MRWAWAGTIESSPEQCSATPGVAGQALTAASATAPVRDYYTNQTTIVWQIGMQPPFRIGIDPGWGDNFEAHLGHFVRSLIDPRKDLRWELIPAPADEVASPEVIDRYDGMIIRAMPFDSSSFAGVERLICISRWGVGFDAIDVEAATRSDVMVALTPEAITRAVAETQIALILALAKRIPDLDRRTRAGLWQRNLPILGMDVVGKTLSSVGLGRIGAEMFRIARGIGFERLLAHDPFCPESRARALDVELVALDTALSQGDFVVLNTPLNSSTRGMIGAREFSLMKPTAYFVNTARGPIVQEPALIDALRSDRIAGAGIDVFEQEPPSPDNPLFALENAIVSPHSMAWTQQGLAGNSRDACRNLLSVAAGQVPPCLADPSAADRRGVRKKLARWSRQ